MVDEEGDENYYSVSFDLQPVQEEVVWENVLIRESMWAYPREQSAKEKMRQCYEDITNKTDGTFATNACEYSMAVQDRFAPSKMYKKFVDEVLGFDSSLIESTEAEPEVMEFE